MQWNEQFLSIQLDDYMWLFTYVWYVTINQMKIEHFFNGRILDTLVLLFSSCRGKTEAQDSKLVAKKPQNLGQSPSCLPAFVLWTLKKSQL